jgi:signal transduction histidine kinase
LSEELQAVLEERLRQEGANAELREQFITVLGHDLPNPLASLSAGARLMLNAKTPEDAVRLEAMMQSSVGRMAKMIESVMDLARGALVAASHFRNCDGAGARPGGGGARRCLS